MSSNNDMAPVVVQLAAEPKAEQGGLTKRELFAAMAMQGLLGDSANILASRKNALTAQEAIANSAVKFADHLITALGNSK